MIMDRKLITKRDAVILVLIFIATLAIFLVMLLNGQKGETAVISVDGKVVEEIRLSDIKEKTLYKPADGVVITAENGKIYFTQSNCKNKICIGTGELSKSGDVAVCVPEKIVISITGSSENTDIVTY